MPNNVFANIPAVVVVTEAVSFAAAGIDATNTRIIYEVGNPLKSFVPGRPINPITAFELDKGYYLIPKVNMDLSLYVVPPLDAYYQNFIIP
jgi:hypothetical protein